MQTYRSNAQVPRRSYADLHKRELLIFGETSLMRREAAQRKVRRGFLKLRVAYRGFTCRMLQRRAERQKRAAVRSVESLFDAAHGFLDWVQNNAPEWLPDAECQLDRDSLIHAHLFGHNIGDRDSDDGHYDSDVDSAESDNADVL